MTYHLAQGVTGQDPFGSSPGESITRAQTHVMSTKASLHLNLRLGWPAVRITHIG